jgi:ERCC4-type nuclease
MRVLNVTIDQQEKRPIRFPFYYRRGADLFRVQMTEAHLRSGDYRLESAGFASVGIERKSSPTELYACFVGNDLARTRKQLERLVATYDRAYLLIDTTPAELLLYRFTELRCPQTENKDIGDTVMQGIIAMTTEFNMSLVWAQRADSGPREMMLGHIVLALLTTQVGLIKPRKIIEIAPK